MKGEYKELDKDPHHPTSMFSKFQHHLHHQPVHLSSTPSPHHFQLTQTSEEADSRSPSRHQQPNSNDGASIEVVRRPRGRPPGSKNKPKPPVIITRESEPSMSPYVLELSGGADIIESLSGFCRKRNTGLCVLTGSGTVANVTLRQPSTTPGATVTFHGRFDILSISATILPSMTPNASIAPPFANGFTISLAGPQGQIVGGAVMGPLVAASTVYIIAASFNNPLYHRLSAEDIDQVRNSNSGGGGANEVGQGQSPSAVSGGGGDSGRQPSAGESCGGMSIYNSSSCHLPSDVIWAPTARQAPPPPPY